MTHPWEAEQTIEPPLALRLIREAFPELGAETIRLLGAGWDNTAFIINEELIFRFPRRQIALPFLEAEWYCLPKLAPLLPLPIPVPQWKGNAAEQFPWPYIGYRALTGFTACYANLSEEARLALAEPIAAFLAALHGTPSSLIAACPIPHDNISRIDGACLTPRIRKNFEELALLGLLDNRKELEAALEELQDFRAPLRSTLVHGDFYVRHLLVDEKHALCGVIDWGDIHLGDPAIDLAIAHSFLPVDAHDKFRKAYGGIAEDTWRLAKLRAIFSSTYVLLFGHHSGDPDLVREGLRSLRILATIQLP